MRILQPLVKPAGAFGAVLLIAACGSTTSSTGQVLSSPSTAASASAAAPTPSPAATPSAPASPSPTPSPATSPTAAAGSLDLASCPAYAAGQHPLGSPGPPGTGVHADPTLDWTGCGSLILPPGTARFITADNWQIGFAATCPNELDYGPGGMGPNVTFTEVLIDTSAGPDSQAGAGPWTDSGGGIMAHGGNYQIRVVSIDPRCRWHLAVYPS